MRTEPGLAVGTDVLQVLEAVAEQRPETAAAERREEEQDDDPHGRAGALDALRLRPDVVLAVEAADVHRVHARLDRAAENHRLLRLPRLRHDEHSRRRLSDHHCLRGEVRGRHRH